MTSANKLAKLKTQLNIGASDTSQDSKLNDYLNSAEIEIIAWIYHNRRGIPTDVTMPAQYDLVQVEAALMMYTLEGGENETTHNENGVNRSFKYSSYIELIQARVIPLIGGI